MPDPKVRTVVALLRVAAAAGSIAFLGPVTYADHRGERPVAFTWKLPEELFEVARSVAAAGTESGNPSRNRVRAVVVSVERRSELERELAERD